MKSGIILFTGIFMLISCTLFSQNKYIGAAKCKMCHNAADKGKQYDLWAASKHAKAFATLKTEEAKKIAKEKGIADPATDAKCLKCHSTAGSIESKLNGGITVEEGVSCESCHGPGSAYKSPTIMKNLEQSKKNGLITPDEKVCQTCHNSESPTYKTFDYKSFSAKIAHPNPKNKK